MRSVSKEKPDPPAGSRSSDPAVPQTLTSRRIYSNPWISVREDRLLWSDGTESLYGLIDMVDGVTVAAMTHDHDVALVREYRPATGVFSLELISGAIDPGEDPFSAAKRELIEEVGGRSSRWQEAGSIDPFTALVNSRSHLFAAWDVEFGTGAGHAGEVLDVQFVPLADAVAMAVDRRISHGPSIVILLTLALSLRG